MQISSKVANLLDDGWELHEEYETIIASNGNEVKIPIGLQPGQICREIDGVFLVYVGE